MNDDEWVTPEIAAEIDAAAAEPRETFDSMEALLDDLHDDERKEESGLGSLLL